MRKKSFFDSYCRFHRNQPVFIEGKDIGKVNGVITAIGTQEVCYYIPVYHYDFCVVSTIFGP